MSKVNLNIYFEKEGIQHSLLSKQSQELLEIVLSPSHLPPTCALKIASPVPSVLTIFFLMCATNYMCLLTLLALLCIHWTLMLYEMQIFIFLNTVSLLNKTLVGSLWLMTHWTVFTGNALSYLSTGDRNQSYWIGPGAKAVLAFPIALCLSQWWLNLVFWIERNRIQGSFEQGKA